MSAELLRRAAAQIRNDRGGVISKNTVDGRRWLPVADWLESVARSLTPPAAGVLGSGRSISPVDEDHALTIARAYLGEAS